MGFQVQDTVGEYTILGELGSGGAGRVFRVEHRVTGRVEAMKILLNDHPEQQEAAERFLREIKLQASLNHPNIASVHHAFWEDGHLVMIMECVAGESLEARLARGPLPLLDGLNYVCQALAALSYAHQRQVIHRDVKPANLIVTPENQIKVTDFGLARTASDPRLTATGAVMGSFYYISPEQVRGLPSIDERSDVYSLGALLYELATGRKPFEHDQSFGLMTAHVNQQPTPPIDVEPSLPQSLNDAILRALAKDPVGRFASADEFHIAIDRVRQELGRSALSPATTQAADAMPELHTTHGVRHASPSAGREPRVNGAPSPPADKGSHPRRSLRRPVWAGVIAATVVAAGFYFLRDSTPEPVSAAAPAPASTPAAAPAPALAVPSGEFLLARKLTAEGEVRELRFDSQLERLAAATDRGLQIWDLESGRQTLRIPGVGAPITFDSGGILLAATVPGGAVIITNLEAPAKRHAFRLPKEPTALAFGPGGERLAAGLRDGTVGLWNAKTGERFQLLPAAGRPPALLQFSPDGKWLAAAASRAGVTAWDLSRKVPAPRRWFEEQSVSLLSFGPRSARVAAASPERLLLLPLAGGEKPDSLPLPGAAVSLTSTPHGHWIALLADPANVRIWDATEGRELGAFYHNTPVQAAVLSRHGLRAATSGEGKDIWIWEMTPQLRQAIGAASKPSPARKATKASQKSQARRSEERRKRKKGLFRKFIGLFR